MLLFPGLVTWGHQSQVLAATSSLGAQYLPLRTWRQLFPSFLVIAEQRPASSWLCFYVSLGDAQCSSPLHGRHRPTTHFWVMLKVPVFQ